MLQTKDLNTYIMLTLLLHAVGFEPTTTRLTVECSTAELCMPRSTGIEPVTFNLEGYCSTAELRTLPRNGIEPLSTDFQSVALPLSYPGSTRSRDWTYDIPIKSRLLCRWAMHVWRKKDLNLQLLAYETNVLPFELFRYALWDSNPHPLTEQILNLPCIPFHQVRTF
jgi:hypothetical protein